MAETFICSVCHTEHAIVDRTIFGGRDFCPECLQAETCVCDHCGERIWLLDACCDETHMLCEDCEERYYEHCAECGRLAPIEDLRYLPDDDNGYCESYYNHHTQENDIRDIDCQRVL